MKGGVSQGKSVTVGWEEFLNNACRQCPEGYSTVAMIAKKFTRQKDWVRKRLRLAAEAGEVQRIRGRDARGYPVWFYKD